MADMFEMAEAITDRVHGKTDSLADLAQVRALEDIRDILAKQAEYNRVIADCVLSFNCRVNALFDLIEDLSTTTKINIKMERKSDADLS